MTRARRRPSPARAVRVTAAVALAVFLASVLVATPVNGDAIPTEPKDRVAYHLDAVEGLRRHFESVLGNECPRFATPAEWETYFDGEVERVVLLLAHLEQAWVEAKRAHDPELKRTAKAPRKQVEDARALLGKLQQCAEDNGSDFAPLTVWRRIEREVPRKQAEIALPD